MGLTVGIDLGTTYSVVAYIDPVSNTPRIIKNELGFTTTPSVVVVDARGDVRIGEDGKTEQEMGNPNTASFYKLEMGHPNFSVQLSGKNYTATDLSSLFLKELIRQSENTIGEKIDNAVITVPAYFEDPERNSTIEAATRAGLNVLGIINEPTAAAIAYGLRNQSDMRNILIYDLGGGTFDVTIAEITSKEIIVRGSAGKHFLGGKNWDEAITNWIAEQFEDEFSESFLEDKDAYNACMVKAEKAKRTLSTAPYADITFEYEGCTGKYRLTNELFKECTVDLLDITKSTINYLLEDVSLTWRDIDGVILVGGSTKMKMVSEYIKEETGKPPLHGVHPDEAVAIGAAIHAESLRRVIPSPTKTLFGTTAGSGMELPGAKEIKDVIAHSLGMISVSADGKRFVNDIMIKRNTALSDASVTKRRELKVSRREEMNELEIYLLQGDMECPLDCTIARKYVFDKIAYVEGGVTYMDIRYYYTKNGTIAIEAVQTETGKKLKCREEPVPSDMSWVMMEPEEYFRLTTKSVPIEGAIYMALDVSGSMSGYPIEEAKRAMINFARKFDTRHVRIGVVAFSDRVHIVTDAISDLKKIEKSICSIRVGMTGSCNAAEPLTIMHQKMRAFRGDSFVYALVLTDGCWDRIACSRAVSMKKEFVKDGMEVIGLGFGGANESFLKEISTRPDFASVEDITQLDSKLSKIARIIQN